MCNHRPIPTANRSRKSMARIKRLAGAEIGDVNVEMEAWP